ncbi:hypothetical protein [Flavobacterium coralii]|uniref:hypothetical protein n=1 Tax=Flavobacterium coralii TaxID=2838017 RepID=UPI000C478622|nr:hypothetical protein [Flavobacterium sp.]|tara:strand:+ start:6808 stop:7131 length:324 start_codon:yes stop_codon:yes gene_type:complete
MKTVSREAKTVLKYPYSEKMAVLRNEFSQLRAIIYKNMGDSATVAAFEAVKAQMRAIAANVVAEQRQQAEALKNKKPVVTVTDYDATEAEQHAIRLFNSDNRFSITE